MLLDSRPAIVPDLIDPTTAEVIDRADADALISAWERCDAEAAKLYAARGHFATAIAALTTGDAKTRRLRGETRLARIEMAKDSWSQQILRELWQASRFAKEFLRISELAVNLIEYRKLASSTATRSDLEEFRRRLTEANLGPGGTPRITVER